MFFKNGNVNFCDSLRCLEVGENLHSFCISPFWQVCNFSAFPLCLLTSHVRAFYNTALATLWRGEQGEVQGLEYRRIVSDSQSQSDTELFFLAHFSWCENWGTSKETIFSSFIFYNNVYSRTCITTHIAKGKHGKQHQSLEKLVGIKLKDFCWTWSWPAVLLRLHFLWQNLKQMWRVLLHSLWYKLQISGVKCLFTDHLRSICTSCRSRWPRWPPR